MDGPIDVIRFKQQQEDMKFLSHFGGKFIIHRVRFLYILCNRIKNTMCANMYIGTKIQGKRNFSEGGDTPALYQIRANGSKICRRVVQVPAVPKSLNSSFW